MAKVNNDIMGLPLQEVFTQHDGIKHLLELLLNCAMRAELADHIKADRYQRCDSRIGRRNGYKPRTFASRIGRLNLQAPKARDCQQYQPSMFHRFQRSERALLITCAQMYFQGISTRKVQDVLQTMCDMDISSATVSAIACELDEKLKIFRCRRLDHTEYPYLQIDARYEKVRVNGHIVSQAVLVAAGFVADGNREILDWRIADSESEDTWGQLFKDLKDRGLKGLKLITSDAHKGIRKAIDRHFQGAAWQRCRVHFKRELFHKVSWRQYRQLMNDIASVFRPEEHTECMFRAAEMADRWRPVYPSVAKMLEEGLEDCLAVCSLEPDVRRKINSTNMLENIMKRLRARTRVVGIFPNRDSCDRLAGALLLEVHEDWQTADKPYVHIMKL